MDVRLSWDTSRAAADVRIVNGDLETGYDLETAVLISLFTDRRAPNDFQPTDGTNDLRGWWADTYETDQIGSYLWTFARAKKTQATVNDVRDAAAKSLQWLIDDGVASAVDVYAEALSGSAIGLKITVHKPGSLPAQFSYVWNGEV